MTPVSQQAGAVEAAIRIVVGAVKPSTSEKNYLSERLRDAARTLRELEARK